MKKLKFLFIFCWVFVFTVSCGQSKLSQPFFWKAEKEGKVHHLLGTVHVGVSLYEIPCADEIVKQIDNSDLVFLERLSPPAKPKENTEQVVKVAFSEDEEADFKSLSTKHQAFLRRRGIKEDYSYADMYFAVNYSCAFEGLGSSFYLQMDNQVEQRAHFNNIPLQALDDLKILLSTIKTVFKKEDVEEIIDNFVPCVSGISEVVNSYKEGELSEISDRDDRDEELARVLLKDRNEKWIEKLNLAHKQHDKVFVAAGASHFTDKFNMVDLLTKEGYTVERAECH